MDVFELEKDSIWRKNLGEFEDSTFYHQLLWRDVVKDTYGYKPIYLVAEDGDVRGLLPLFGIDNIFGKRLISVPFAPYGGICAKDESARRALKEYAKSLAKDVDYLELRCFGDGGEFCTFILKLKDEESMWNDLNKKVRNSIRKAVRSGLTFEIDDGRLDEFYSVYFKNMHEIGSPVHPRSFFERLLKHDCVSLALVELDGKVIAGTILLKYRDTVISGWAGSDRRYLKLRPNNLLYWGCITYAWESGFERFDFGRSLVGSGTFRFKRAWGGKEKYLKYEFYPKRKIDTSMKNPMRRRFASVWRITPLPIAKILSPRLRGLFP